MSWMMKCGPSPAEMVSISCQMAVGSFTHTGPFPFASSTDFFFFFSMMLMAEN